LYLVEYILEFSKAWFKTDDIKMLDWGCGKGYVSWLLKKRNIDVTSCDVEKQDVTSAFGQYTPLISHAGICVVPLKHEYLLPFEDESFNVVLSFGVLEHVPNDFESLKEIRRVLKPNGLFFCSYLPYVFSYTQRIAHLRGQYYHDHLCSHELIVDLLRCAGMKMIDSWHRALMPKRSMTLPFYRMLEKMDNWFCNNTILKHLATNIEFIAYKDERES
jgi:ubiquinone/menaquinone biosynthesis C-methylase UbiE